MKKQPRRTFKLKRAQQKHLETLREISAQNEMKKETTETSSESSSETSKQN